MRPRTIKHFSLHRIEDTELRVVSDVENGVLPVVQVEERVIQGYIQGKAWPHREVTLLILQDMQPLVHQLGLIVATPHARCPMPDARWSGAGSGAGQALERGRLWSEAGSASRRRRGPG